MTRGSSDHPTRLPEAYEEVFLPLEEPTVFRNSGWNSVLLPYGLHLEDDVAGAFFAALSRTGNTTVTITDVETIPPHQDTRRVIASPGAVATVRAGSVLGHVDVRVVGESGRWGGEAANEGLLLLGGDEEFMAAFLASAGGVELLRTRYRRFTNDEWFEPDEAAGRIRSSVSWPSSSSA